MDKKIIIKNKYGEFIVIKRYDDETHYNEYYDIINTEGKFIFRFLSSVLYDDDKLFFEKELEKKLKNYI